MRLSTRLPSLFACTIEVPGAGQILLTEDVIDLGDVSVGTFLTKQVGLKNIEGVAAGLLSSTAFEGEQERWTADREGEGTLWEDQATLSLNLLGQGSASQQDADGDGYPPANGDCAGNDPDIWPFNEEICDSKDNDCNTEVDEVDEDHDGVTACEGDCDDSNPNVWPMFVSTTGGTPSDDPKKKGADGSQNDRGFTGGPG